LRCLRENNVNQYSQSIDSALDAADSYAQDTG